VRVAAKMTAWYSTARAKFVGLTWPDRAHFEMILDAPGVPAERWNRRLTLVVRPIRGGTHRYAEGHMHPVTGRITWERGAKLVARYGTLIDTMVGWLLDERVPPRETGHAEYDVVVGS
jgi:hypothetical protein